MVKKQLLKTFIQAIEVSFWCYVIFFPTSMTKYTHVQTLTWKSDLCGNKDENWDCRRWGSKRGQQNREVYWAKHHSLLQYNPTGGSSVWGHIWLFGLKWIKPHVYTNLFWCRSTGSHGRDEPAPLQCSSSGMGKCRAESRKRIESITLLLGRSTHYILVDQISSLL